MNPETKEHFQNYYKNQDSLIECLMYLNSQRDITIIDTWNLEYLFQIYREKKQAVDKEFYHRKLEAALNRIGRQKIFDLIKTNQEISPQEDKDPMFS